MTTEQKQALDRATVTLRAQIREYPDNIRAYVNAIVHKAIELGHSPDVAWKYAFADVKVAGYFHLL